jgi:hypothetical protein
MAEFVESGLLGDVNEDHRSAVHKSASRDGTRQRIFDRSMRSASGYACGLRLRRFGVILILIPGKTVQEK